MTSEERDAIGRVVSTTIIDQMEEASRQIDNDFLTVRSASCVIRTPSDGKRYCVTVERCE
jgi:hypothetical protein